MHTLSVVLLAIAVSWYLPPGLDVSQQAPAAQPEARWDAAFTRTSGWTGGDVAGSVALEDRRTVWVFGDSWIGNVAQGKHSAGSRMINNAIAVHENPVAKGGTAPDPAKLSFYHGASDSQGGPTAWIAPDRRLSATSAAKNYWYWPTGGGIEVTGAISPRRLILFLFRVRRGDMPGSSWNFRVVGTAMAVVENPADSADKWRVRTIDLPDLDHAANSRNKQPQPTTLWGMAACRGVPTAGGQVDVYVFGVRSRNPLSRQMVVSRATADQVEDFRSWRFFAGEKWSQRTQDASPIAENLASEFSVGVLNSSGRARWLLVQSEALFGRRILIRTASRPEGPWSQPIAVHTVSEVEGKPSLWTYAAKGHLHLSRPGEMLVSYIVSSHKFPELVNDASLYRPRFVRVPLGFLGDQPSPGR